jgi:membrane DNA delivery protein
MRYNDFAPAIVAVLASIIGLAIISVLVSQKAQTGSVINAAGSALSSIIGAAVSPVTGATGNTFGSTGSATGGLAG